MNLTAVLEFLHINLKCQPTELSDIILDSRQVRPGALFIAIKGLKTDGSQYIQQAIQLGAGAVLVEDLQQDQQINIPSQIQDVNSNVQIISVVNLRARLPFLAAFFYADPAQSLQVIGITGTNGKTSISHYTAQILSAGKIPCGVMGTLGNGMLGKLQASSLTTSDACTVQKQLAEFVQAKISTVAIEVSSHALDQDRLAGTNIHTAVFTNLTQDHLDYHANLAEYFAAKARLFYEYQPQNCVINFDDPYGKILIEQLRNSQLPNALRKNNFSFLSSPNSLRSDSVSLKTENYSYTAPKIYTYSLNDQNADLYLDGDLIYTPWGSGIFKSSLIGNFNKYNLLACIACCAIQGMSLPIILEAILNIHPVAGRMQIAGYSSRSQGPLVVIDYAHTPDALVKALQALREHATDPHAKLTCIFGCGGDRDRTKRPLMLDAVIAHSDHIIITQDNPRTEDPQQIVMDMLRAQPLTAQITVVLDRAQAINQVIAQAGVHDLILIAGKGHEDYQIIGTQKYPFSDLSIAEQALATKRSTNAWAV